MRQRHTHHKIFWWCPVWLMVMISIHNTPKLTLSFWWAGKDATGSWSRPTSTKEVHNSNTPVSFTSGEDGFSPINSFQSRCYFDNIKTEASLRHIAVEWPRSSSSTRSIRVQVQLMLATSPAISWKGCSYLGMVLGFPRALTGFLAP